MSETPQDGWKHSGVRVVPGDQLGDVAATTPGMDRAVAVDRARMGAQKLWAGTVHITPTPRPGPTTTGRWRA